MKKLVLNLVVLLAFTFSNATFGALMLPTTTDSYCPAPPTMVTLKAGTIVSLQLNEEVKASEIEVGNTLDFFVRSNVTVNGNVVIAAGSIAEGWVKKVTKGCNGKCSHITITVENVQAVDGQRIYLRSIPHKVTANCCQSCGNPPNDAVLQIGTSLSARILNDVDIDA